MTFVDKQPTLLSPEGDAELKRLYADLAHASRRATAFLRTSGMTSAAFLRADREVTRRPYRQALDGALTRTNSGSFATLAAIRRASSRVSWAFCGGCLGLISYQKGSLRFCKQVHRSAYLQ